MRIERFDLDHCDGESGSCRAKMIASHNGDWVSYEDYETLEAKYNGLDKAIQEAKRILS